MIAEVKKVTISQDIFNLSQIIVRVYHGASGWFRDDLTNKVCVKIPDIITSCSGDLRRKPF